MMRDIFAEVSEDTARKTRYFTWPRRCRDSIHTAPYFRTAYCTVTPLGEVLQQPQEELSTGKHVINLLSDGNFDRPELQIRMYGGAKKRDYSSYPEGGKTTVLNNS
jgi:hypothetical protein